MIMYDKENMNTRKNEKPWHKNSANYLIVNSIFAVISVFFIGLLFQVPIKHTINEHLSDISVLFGVIALFVLIVTSEKTVHAVEEDDVRKYIAYMLPYNFGVLSLFISLDLGLLERIQSLWISRGVFVLSIVFWIPFGKSVYFHFTSTKDKFNEYISELEGKKLPESEWGKHCFSFTRVYFFLRRKWPRLLRKIFFYVIIFVVIFGILWMNLQDLYPQWLKWLKDFRCP